MSKHTPGPWTYQRWFDAFDLNPSDVGIEDIQQVPIVRVAGPNDETVASASDLFEFKEADAKLIAAAPDLLEALEYIMGNPETMLAPSAIYKAHKAIKKAKGEQQ